MQIHQIEELIVCEKHIFISRSEIAMLDGVKFLVTHRIVLR